MLKPCKSTHFSRYDKGMCGKLNLFGEIGVIQLDEWDGMLCRGGRPASWGVLPRFLPAADEVLASVLPPFSCSGGVLPGGRLCQVGKNG